MTSIRPDTTAAVRGSQRLILKNTILLVGAQAVSMPLSLVLTAAIARYLGAEEFGLLYLGPRSSPSGSCSSTGARTVPFRRSSRRIAPALGSSWAAGSPGACSQRPSSTACSPWAATLSAIPGNFRSSSRSRRWRRHRRAGGACQDAVRGFERTDIAALSMIAQQVLSFALVVPVLVMGGRLTGILITFAGVNALVLLFVVRALRPVGVGRLRPKVDTARMLAVEGWPFLLFGLTMALQPNIDAIFLSKLAPAEVVGWHAAARKLAGVLVFPASALIAALYPTLCRLYADDERAFRETANGALRTSALVVGPVALGTALFADDAIRIFSKEAFGPAADNLRYLAPLIFLVYFSMPLGSSLLAAGASGPGQACSFSAWS